VSDFLSRISHFSPKRLALLADELQHRVSALEDQLEQQLQRVHQPVAIVGIGCRFPGHVDSPEAYWSLLEQGIDAIEEVPRERVNKYGVLDIAEDKGRLVSVKGLVEKPKPEDAPSNLTVIGRYVLMPEVLAHLSKMERGAGGEVQLTDAMAKLIGTQPFHGLRYEGRRFDCGDKVGFLEAQIAFALQRPDIAQAVHDFLPKYV